ncbi:MAG: VWA domain-containing protein [Deltaproteobacteria bacterium]|nr:VWA domain-containing protein [Deltaproteobacteria bacterium]
MNDFYLSYVYKLSSSYVIIFSIAGALALLWTFINFSKNLTNSKKAVILILRAVIFIFALLIFMQPTLTLSQTELKRPDIAILIDTSGSMTSDNSNRSKQLSSIINNNFKFCQNKNDKKNSAKCVFYTFNESIKKTVLKDITRTIKLNQTSTSLKTDITKALNAVSAESDGRYSSIIILSDGADNFSDDNIEKLNTQIPVHTVLVGNNKDSDIKISKIKSDWFAFLHKPFPVHVYIKNRGRNVEKINVSLLHDNKLISSKKITLKSDTEDIKFNVTPQKTGIQIYTVSLDNLTSKSSINSNSKYFSVKVSRDKYRILHLSGSPTFDQRFLRDTIKQWPMAELVSFYLLRNRLQSANDNTSGLSLIPFPKDELFLKHLDEFDIIIMQDFDPYSAGVDKYIDKISEFVLNGGGLFILGGEKSFKSRSIYTSSLKELLPVKLKSPSKTLTLPENESLFTPRVSQQAKNHPLIQFKSKSFQDIIFNMPKLAGIISTGGLNDNAVKLLEHPYVKSNSKKAPLLAVTEREDGRIIALTTDSLWRWRFVGPVNGGDGNFYTEFIKRSFKWLVKDPELERLKLQIETGDYDIKKVITFNISVNMPDFTPAGGQKVKLEIFKTTPVSDQNAINESQSIFKKSFATDSSGIHNQEWYPKKSGTYKVIVSVKEQHLLLEEQFLIKPDSSEYDYMDTNPQYLKKLSDKTRGQFFNNTFNFKNINNDHNRFKKTVLKKSYPVWASPITLLIMLMLLFIQWYLGRKSGLP